MRTRRTQGAGFTILEVMIAIGIFSMILLSIYSIWMGILRASKATRTAADAAQRARISMRTLEDALLTAQMFTGNMPPQNPEAYYSFLADSSGDFSSLSFVAHLPATFPGVGRFGDQIVRRVTFTVEPEKDNTLSLVMRQAPMLQSMDSEYEPYSLVLAKHVEMFMIEFWGPQKENQREFGWVNEWNSTNQLPKLVRVALGLGKTSQSGVPQDLVYRVIAIPSSSVPPQWQGIGGPITTVR